MDQILRNTKSKLLVELTVDGVPTDIAAAGVPTVTITRDDGSALVSAQPGVKEEDVGTYSYSLTPAQTASLDLLTANWTATLAGAAGQVFTTQHEIVGGSICSTDAIKQALPSDMSVPDVDDLLQARIYAESLLEDACGVAFRPRYAHDILDGTGGGQLMLRHPRPLTLRSLTVNGGAGDLAGVKLYLSGAIYRPSGWWPGRSNIEVIYEHGYQVAPAPVAKAAAKLGRWYLMEDPTNLDERATNVTTADASYSLVTPGVQGALTALPEVNTVIRQYASMGMG